MPNASAPDETCKDASKDGPSKDQTFNDKRSRGMRRPHKMNWLGRAVQWGGLAQAWVQEAADTVQTRTRAVAERSKKAFYEGLDPNIDEAQVLDECDEDSRP